MSFENRYSALDRTLHRMAFATAPVQVAVADMEDQMYAAQLEPIVVQRPVFVTGLPRAGTTLLLETLESLPEFVSHTYRNMPFVLCPMFWNKFSSRFHSEGEAQERAHQDGILLTTESPEAFEEMLWKAFFRRQYRKDRIRPWAEDDADFFEFMRNHMRKIIALSEPNVETPRRYLSKNNLNIARIDLLRKNFPDAVIIVPFRDPLQHAASLLRQHHNFLEMHKEDKFSRQYMAGIGHYDFGENLRPIDFGDWLDRAEFKDATTLEFWLEYWFESYSHLANREGINLLCYEDMCAAPAESLAWLADVVQPTDPNALLSLAARIRSPRPHSIDVDSAADELANKARELYQALRRLAG